MILQRIQSHLRASLPDDAPRVGPFRINFHPDTDNLFRNYAVPDDAADPGADDVAALLAWFHEHRRSPRLEYVSPAPAVDAALAAAGFTVERQLPLLVLYTLTEPPTPDGAQLLLATTDADLHDCARVQNAAYGEGEPTAADLARLAGTNARGGAVALARLAGEPASSAVFSAPKDGLAEVAAVGTVAHLRGRGLASAVVALLSATALRRGATPYLQAESPREAAIYARLGYRHVGELALVNGLRAE